MRNGREFATVRRGHTYLLLLFLVVVVLITSLYFDSFLQTEPLIEGDQIKLDSGWTLSSGSTRLAQNLSLPYQIEGDVAGRDYHLKRMLPDEFPNSNASLSVDTSMSSLEVLIDDRSIYSFSGEPTRWGKPILGGGFTHFIRLPDWSPGHEITIVMNFTSNNPFAGLLRAPVIGTKTDQLMSQMRELPSLAFGFIFLFTGLVCVLTALGLRSGRERESIWYFGWLEIALGAWVFTQNCAKLLIIRNPVLPMNFSIVALFILPYFLIQYVRVSYMVIERKLRPFLYASAGFLIAYVMGGIGQVTGLFEYPDMLLIAGLALVLYIVALFVVLLVDYRRGNRELISFLLAIGALFITVLAEEVLLILSIPVDNALILHVGMSLCGAVLLVHSARVVSQGRRTQFREQMLLELAYTDSLTGVGNRAAYENRIKEISNRGKRSQVIGVLLCDVNDLKPINDSFGHAIGDRILKDIAVRVTEMLPDETEIFRIGGDEFVTFIHHITEEQLSLLCSRIHSRVFQAGGCRYNVACGYSLYMKERTKTFTDIIGEADGAMYACKASMKSEQTGDEYLVSN
jgi:diguanylate cyclase (GGDEF)-like protein